MLWRCGCFALMPRFHGLMAMLMTDYRLLSCGLNSGEEAWSISQWFLTTLEIFKTPPQVHSKIPCLWLCHLNNSHHTWTLCLRLVLIYFFMNSMFTIGTNILFRVDMMVTNIINPSHRKKQKFHEMKIRLRTTKAMNKTINVIILVTLLILI